MPLLDWIRDNHLVIWPIAAASVVLLVGSLLAMPVIVARIPADYFAHERRPASRFAAHHPAIRLTLLVAKNVLGGVLLVAGLAMLVLPGQGLLTLLVGFLLLDFPGKYRFERWLIGRRVVRRPIDWLRRRARRPSLETEIVESEDADRSPGGAA